MLVIVPPAKVLVLGTGVAGLAAIQTAKNMGAIVRAFDVRPVTKEQVEAMGGQFLEVDFKEVRGLAAASITFPLLTPYPPFRTAPEREATPRRCPPSGTPLRRVFLPSSARTSTSSSPPL